MDRFVAHYTNRIDAKGRVSLPAAFRAILVRDGLEALHVHPAFGLPTFDCGGQRLLSELDQLIARFPAYSRERELISHRVFGGSLQLKLDGEGRFVVPDTIRAHAGIADALVFVGMGYKFQIWSPERFAEREAAAEAQMHGLLDRLSGLPGSDGAST
jgi:MraZ protein